jgi:hypothetical protein
MKVVVSAAGSVSRNVGHANANIRMTRKSNLSNDTTGTKPFITFRNICRFHRRVKAPKMISSGTAITIYQRTHVSTGRAVIFVELVCHCQAMKD